MCLYSFRIFDGLHHVDPETVELSDLAAARVEGIRRAAAALVLDAHIIRPKNDWHLEVNDPAGTLLFRMDFALTTSPAAGGG